MHIYSKLYFKANIRIISTPEKRLPLYKTGNFTFFITKKADSSWNQPFSCYMQIILFFPEFTHIFQSFTFGFGNHFPYKNC